jgi:hypothetical protein
MPPLAVNPLAVLHHAISPDRFGTYRAAARGDDDLARQLYVWDRDLAVAVLRDIAILEMALRNAMHLTASAQWGIHWYADRSVILDDGVPTSSNRLGMTYPAVFNETQGTLRPPANSWLGACLGSGLTYWTPAIMWDRNHVVFVCWLRRSLAPCVQQGSRMGARYSQERKRSPQPRRTSRTANQRVSPPRTAEPDDCPGRPRSVHASGQNAGPRPGRMDSREYADPFGSGLSPYAVDGLDAQPGHSTDGL